MSKRIIILMLISSFVLAQNKVRYKYKKRESIDLGELSLKGNVVSPGDLSSKKRNTRKLKFKIPVRKHFDDIMLFDIETAF